VGHFRRIAIRGYRSIAKANIKLGEITVVIGPSDVGKCLGRGTLVLLSNGRTKPVEEIKPGERLMGPDGRARVVLSTSRGRGPLFRIEPKKGDPWVCNDRHVLTLIRGGSEEMIDVELSEWLRSNTTFKATHKLRLMGVDRFEDPPKATNLDPYFLGVWFGEGTKTLVHSARKDVEELKVVSIANPDPEIRSLCEAEAEKWGLRIKTYDEDRCPMMFFFGKRGRPNDMLDALREDVGPEIKIPDRIMRSSRDVRLEFLAGFLDADGYLHNNCFEITQKREDWARAVWWIARSLGFVSTIHPKVSRCQNGYEGTYFRVGISGNTDQIPTRIPRRQASPRKSIRGVGRLGFSVVPLGDGEYFGFQLDGDGRFLLGDFMVTHNSNLIRALRDWAFNVSGTRFLTEGMSIMRVAVAVGDRYKVVFTKERKSKKGSSSYVVVDAETGEKIKWEKIGLTVPEEVVDITGIRPIKATDDLSVRINFSEQGEPWFLLSPLAWTGSRVSKVVGQISGVDALTSGCRDLVYLRGVRRRDAKRARERIEERRGVLEEFEDLDARGKILKRAETKLVQVGRAERLLKEAVRLTSRAEELGQDLEKAREAVAASSRVSVWVEAGEFLEDLARLERAEKLHVRAESLRVDLERAQQGRAETRKRLSKHAIELTKLARTGRVCSVCGGAPHRECVVALKAQAQDAQDWTP